MSQASSESQQPSHLPPVDGAGLKKKARIGLIALGARALILQLLVFGSNVALAHLLDPADFGAFAIV